MVIIGFGLWFINYLVFVLLVAIVVYSNYIFEFFRNKLNKKNKQCYNSEIAPQSLVEDREELHGLEQNPIGLNKE